MCIISGKSRSKGTIYEKPPLWNFWVTLRRLDRFQEYFCFQWSPSRTRSILYHVVRSGSPRLTHEGRRSDGPVKRRDRPSSRKVVTIFLPFCFYSLSFPLSNTIVCPFSRLFLVPVCLPSTVSLIKNRCFWRIEDEVWYCGIDAPITKF